jgi:hypothetical protein
MSKLGFPNCLIINNIKENVAPRICILGGVYDAYFSVCASVYTWCKEGISGYLPTYNFIT